jgi:hypothetical protein
MAARYVNRETPNDGRQPVVLTEDTPKLCYLCGYEIDPRERAALIGAGSAALAGCLFFIFALVDCAFRLAVLR